MIFSNRISKFGKGENLSARMDNKTSITIYYFLDGIMKKNVKIDKDNLSLTKLKSSLPYNEVVPIDEKYLVTRINKSLGVTSE